LGESLIPAIVPVLRKLNLEERVAAIGLYKPGVSFTFGREEEIDFCFKSVSRCDLPTYAYNVPRPAFDALLDERATELGARRVRARAKIERVGEDGLRLSDETLALAPWFNGRQPDLLVDSTGRSRLFARTLEIPSDLGPRRDVSYFAHYHGFKDREPRGQVIIGRLNRGWSWRIPLRDCISVGVVMNKDDAAPLGATPEERLENAIAQDPVLAEAGTQRQRITEVATYTNYQLVSQRGFGPGWVMTGDAFGFVDPMLSPGLWLALRSAELLTENLDNLPSYAR
jgi:flavin-dependent dehydrogenase